MYARFADPSFYLFSWLELRGFYSKQNGKTTQLCLNYHRYISAALRQPSQVRVQRQSEQRHYQGRRNISIFGRSILVYQYTNGIGTGQNKSKMEVIRGTHNYTQTIIYGYS